MSSEFLYKEILIFQDLPNSMPYLKRLFGSCSRMSWVAQWAKIKIYLLGSALSRTMIQELEGKMAGQPAFLPVPHLVEAKWILFNLIWTCLVTGGSSHIQWREIRLAHCGWQIIVSAPPPPGPGSIWSQILRVWLYYLQSPAQVILSFLSLKKGLSWATAYYNCAQNTNLLVFRWKYCKLRKTIEWGEFYSFVSHPEKFLIALEIDTYWCQTLFWVFSICSLLVLRNPQDASSPPDPGGFWVVYWELRCYIHHCKQWCRPYSCFLAHLWSITDIEMVLSQSTLGLIWVMQPSLRTITL